MSSLLEHPNPEATDDRILAIADECFGLAGTISRLDSERDLNALIDSGEGRLRASASLGISQVRLASLGSGLSEPACRPSRSHQDRGVCASLVSPGAILPNTSSFSSK